MEKKEMFALTNEFKQIKITQDLVPVSQSTFRVMTWNILADAYVSLSYFPYAQIGYLKYDTRIAKIKKQIRDKQPEILCLQEVDGKKIFFNFLKQLGYEYVYRQKGTQGILIAYKKKLFQLKLEKIIDFDNFVSQKIHTKSVYMRGHGAIILKLETLSKKNIIIATTHIFWDPKFERVKYHQICTIIASIYTILKPEDSIILSGDFNSLPESNVIKLILKNQNPQIQNCSESNFKEMIEKYEEIKGKLIKFRSAYDQQDGKYTNYTHEFKGKIDYIFYSSQNLEVIQTQKLPEEELLKSEVALPNKIFPSDHIPLMAKFIIKNPHKI